MALKINKSPQYRVVILDLFSDSNSDLNPNLFSDSNPNLNPNPNSNSNSNSKINGFTVVKPGGKWF